MATRKDLQILREFRTLKKNRALLGDVQYEKELKRLLADLKADIAAPEISSLEKKMLVKLLTDGD